MKRNIYIRERESIEGIKVILFLTAAEDAAYKNGSFKIIENNDYHTMQIKLLKPCKQRGVPDQILAYWRTDVHVGHDFHNLRYKLFWEKLYPSELKTLTYHLDILPLEYKALTLNPYITVKVDDSFHPLPPDIEIYHKLTGRYITTFTCSDPLLKYLID